jgi:hypothetical protein
MWIAVFWAAKQNAWHIWVQETTENVKKWTCAHYTLALPYATWFLLPKPKMLYHWQSYTCRPKEQPNRGRAQYTKVHIINYMLRASIVSYHTIQGMSVSYFINWDPSIWCAHGHSSRLIQTNLHQKCNITLGAWGTCLYKVLYHDFLYQCVKEWSCWTTFINTVKPQFYTFVRNI